ncbi:unnamed protein product (macronuclear) [Paramecium tetraurelia]|uniref:Uncharacterized protein n=1 Tax=Paramecium tetraurelia TaxID=5888 RepID=A0C5N3_PARTE|nr:uncharacterized protein GSPATT00035229001 [Paramecium tetraurelia]CAK66100.1 unnamed protein product [Paramecium tetraurelia]|eukprot:XP_001433497.1 hypothetical protein (macronuclear) [Paramecium tetraurelia strain d4-2]
MLNNCDELHILRLPKIVNTFAKDEFLQLSMKVSKINEYGNKHTRYFVLTNKKILLLNKSSNNNVIQKRLEGKYFCPLSLGSRFPPRVLSSYYILKMNMMMMISDYKLRVDPDQLNSLSRLMHLSFTSLQPHTKFKI